MIIDSLLLHLVLAFLVGSIWVIAITIIAEKKGSLLGGILGGLPSTSAFSFLFIGINQSSAVAVQATTLFPLAFSITSAYLFFYAFFAKREFALGISISLFIWFAASALVFASGLNSFAPSLVLGVAISVVTYFAFAQKLKLKNEQGEERLYRFHEVLIRGIGAGALIVISVLLSQFAGPVLGGIAAAFPAVFTSTIVILNNSRGTEFSRSITKPLVISGILTIIPYCISVRYLYPILGIWTGTLASYALVTPLATLSYYIARK